MMLIIEFPGGREFSADYFAARCEHIILDAARSTTGGPIWHSNWEPGSWRAFTGFGETYDSLRTMQWPLEGCT